VFSALLRPNKENYNFMVEVVVHHCHSGRRVDNVNLIIYSGYNHHLRTGLAGKLDAKSVFIKEKQSVPQRFL